MKLLTCSSRRCQASATTSACTGFVGRMMFVKPGTTATFCADPLYR